MSIEVGVVLAHLTNRLLVLEGNHPPSANIVPYDGRVDNSRPSRITDLIELPVPWIDSDAAELDSVEGLELTDHSLHDVIFYFPSSRDLLTQDATAFARGRQHWVTVTDRHDRIPLLRLTEQPLIPDTQTPQHRKNLSFYSYLFYLDDEFRRSAYRTLSRMVPQTPYRELATRIASDLGSFNAVHLRRGDFKLTYGVTTLDRKPWEAIEAMDQVFRRDDPLVILTDERDDPFFREIVAAYPASLFIDWHILDHYGEEFARLPQSDSICLAHLSQLVAGESDNFIGTMTSTFTALVQRYRGNGGKHEPFRYLWNEIPDEGSRLERGRHNLSDCIALDQGIMVEEQDGPYTWNRVSQRLNPSWMREWPESFLLTDVLDSGQLTLQHREPLAVTQYVNHRDVSSHAVFVQFENVQVGIRASDPVLLSQLAPSFYAESRDTGSNVIADFWLHSREDGYEITLDEKTVDHAADLAELRGRLRHQLIRILDQARPRFSWLRGAALVREGCAMVLAADNDANSDSLITALAGLGWDQLETESAAIRVADLKVAPLGASSQPEGAGTRFIRSPTPLGAIIVATETLHTRDTLAQAGPAAAVAELVRYSLDLPFNRNRAVERLCRICEQRPIAHVLFSRSEHAAELISGWMDRCQKRTSA
jgi:hypothetical protein